MNIETKIIEFLRGRLSSTLSHLAESIEETEFDTLHAVENLTATGKIVSFAGEDPTSPYNCTVLVPRN